MSVLTLAPTATTLHCPACGSEGRASWEDSEEGAGTLVRISGGFFVRGSDERGQLEIACLKCLAER